MYLYIYLFGLSLLLYSFDQFSWALGGRRALQQHDLLLCGTYPIPDAAKTPN